MESLEKEKGRVRRGEYGERVKRKRGESYKGRAGIQKREELEGESRDEEVEN